MLIKIVVKDAISGLDTVIKKPALSSICENEFYVNEDSFSEEQLETLTLQVEQKCKYRKCYVEYYESQDGQFWSPGITF